MKGLMHYIWNGLALAGLIDLAAVLLFVLGIMVREFVLVASYRSYDLVAMFFVAIALSNLLARTVRLYQDV